MRRIRNIVLVILLSSLAVLALLDGYEFWNTWTLRYRLTLIVDTPEGRRSGSSVIEVSVGQTLIRFPESINSTRVNGEAVAVDLGNSKTIFALLRSRNDVDNASNIIWKSFLRPEWKGGETTSDGLRYYQALRGRTSVPSSAMPVLVHFSNINDPKTVASIENFSTAAAFGPDFVLAETMIEMVPAGIWPFNTLGFNWPQFLMGVPLNNSLTQTLGWLVQWQERGGTISGKSRFDKPPPLDEILLVHDFKRQGF